MDTMPLSIHPLTPAEFQAAAPVLVDVYLRAMRYPARLRESRITAWQRDCTLPGFRSVCALHTPPTHSSHAPGASPGIPRITPTNLAGIAYGFLGSPETWWHQQVGRGLRYRGQPASLLDNYFEVAEVHVTPALQGQGLGRLLLSHLLSHAPGRTALLSTPEVPGEANRAFRLYRSFGFRDVLRSFYFPGDSRPFAVLGAPLPPVPPEDQVSPTG